PPFGGTQREGGTSDSAARMVDLKELHPRLTAAAAALPVVGQDLRLEAPTLLVMALPVLGLLLLTARLTEGATRHRGLLASAALPGGAPPGSHQFGGEGVIDAELNYGPCVVCGVSQNHPQWVSRMPCESCGQVICHRCADTGVYGSLPDFRHFVT